MKLILTVLVMLSSLAVSANDAPAAPQSTASALRINFPVIREVLDNGLTVLLVEDHTVPMISYHTWYNIGSRDEREGVTGSAHMLEHMMFQGAKKYSGKDFHRLMEESGIDWNAFTSNDYTGFYMNLPSSKLDLVMDVELDRMSSLVLVEKNLQSEREVVKEERRWRVDNNPMGLLRELTMSTIFKFHPYKWPVIGHMKDIENYDVNTLRQFYETYYVPNNTVLVVAGDFEPNAVMKKIKALYGKLPRKELPPRKPVTEPAQTAQYNAKLRKDVQSTSFNVAYRTVPQGDADMYALDLAATILGSGSSSRLHRRLVYQSAIATSAGASSMTLRDDGLFWVGISMKPGHTQDQALEMVYNEIYRLRNTLVTPEELRKAKTITMKGYVDGLRTIDAKARALAATEITMGSYESLFTDLEKYEAVTAEQVKQVANKYLNQTQRSIIVLEPAAKGGAR